jgi:hypothetical protein
LTRKESRPTSQGVTEKPSETNPKTPPGGSAKAEREARLAAALRLNLRRRKAPAPQRAGPSAADDSD